MLLLCVVCVFPLVADVCLRLSRRACLGSAPPYLAARYFGHRGSYMHTMLILCVLDVLVFFWGVGAWWWQAYPYRLGASRLFPGSPDRRAGWRFSRLLAADGCAGGPGVAYTGVRPGDAVRVMRLPTVFASGGYILARGYGHTVTEHGLGTRVSERRFGPPVAARRRPVTQLGWPHGHSTRVSAMVGRRIRSVNSGGRQGRRGQGVRSGGSVRERGSPPASG